VIFTHTRKQFLVNTAYGGVMRSNKNKGAILAISYTLWRVKRDYYARSAAPFQWYSSAYKRMNSPE